jgi:hypothetical protein
MKANTTVNTIPTPTIQAIKGTYLNISRLTPLLEVNVVDPVKFNVIKAVQPPPQPSAAREREPLLQEPAPTDHTR